MKKTCTLIITYLLLLIKLTAKRHMNLEPKINRDDFLTKEISFIFIDEKIYGDTSVCKYLFSPIP